MSRLPSSAALAAVIALCTSAPAFAAGEILITQAKALAGNVTPGDAPGFPVTLSRPGLYLFASNILPTADVAGIHAAHRNITIDLNGFELHGGAVAKHGIVGSQPGTTIRNGTIMGFKFDGISASATGSFWIVEHLQVRQNGRYGVSVSDGSRILSNAIVQNNGFGILCNSSCHISDNTVSFNGFSGGGSSAGIRMFSGTVIGNTIANNAFFGLGALNVVGFGNNTFTGNNSGGQQVDGLLFPLLPNACNPACP